MNRERIKVKSSLVTSSDKGRIHAAQACREYNHKTFMAKGEHFKTVEVSGEVKFDVPKTEDSYITVTVKGKKIRFTLEEHRILKLMKFI